MSSTMLGRKGYGDIPRSFNWSVDNNVDRDAITEGAEGFPLTVEDIGRECRVGTASPYAYYRLEAIQFTPTLALTWSANLVGGGGGGGGVTDHGLLDGLGDDDHTQYQLRSERNQSEGYAGLTAGKIAGTQQTYGTAANTAAQGNDARLSDARQLAAGTDKTKLDALPDAAALTSSFNGKAAVATEQGFMGTPRTLTGADTAIAADIGADLDTSAAADFNFTFNNGLGRKGCIITVYVGSTGAITPVQGTGTVTFVPLPGKTVKSGVAGSVVQYRKKTHSGAGDVWNVTGTLV